MGFLKRKIRFKGFLLIFSQIPTTSIISPLRTLKGPKRNREYREKSLGKNLFVCTWYGTANSATTYYHKIIRKEHPIRQHRSLLSVRQNQGNSNRVKSESRRNKCKSKLAQNKPQSKSTGDRGSTQYCSFGYAAVLNCRKPPRCIGYATKSNVKPHRVASAPRTTNSK